jgi:hypothetical protein
MSPRPTLHRESRTWFRTRHAAPCKTEVHPSAELSEQCHAPPVVLVERLRTCHHVCHGRQSCVTCAQTNVGMLAVAGTSRYARVLGPVGYSRVRWMGLVVGISWLQALRVGPAGVTCCAHLNPDRTSYMRKGGKKKVGREAEESCFFRGLSGAKRRGGKRSFPPGDLSSRSPGSWHCSDSCLDQTPSTSSTFLSHRQAFFVSARLYHASYSKLHTPYSILHSYLVKIRPSSTPWVHCPRNPSSRSTSGYDSAIANSPSRIESGLTRYRPSSSPVARRAWVSALQSSSLPRARMSSSLPAVSRRSRALSRR